MKQANDGQTPRPDIQQPLTQPVVKTVPQYEPLLNLNLSNGAEALDNAVHARGGNGIFGEPKVCVMYCSLYVALLCCSRDASASDFIVILCLKYTMELFKYNITGTLSISLEQGRNLFLF